MFTILAVRIYLLAIRIPVYLLYHFGPRRWIWHLLSIMAALAIGFVPTPPAWKATELDLFFGFSFVSLMTWGIGGFVAFRRHRVRHA
jgi:hypothetical protein